MMKDPRMPNRMTAAFFSEMEIGPGERPVIMLVEDDDELRGALSQVLRRVGYTVHEFSDGEKAGWFISERPRLQLVVCDILMPGADGLELIRAIRKSKLATRILAISGNSLFEADHLLALARNLGADRTLGKPFSPARFLKVVIEMIHAVA